MDNIKIPIDAKLNIEDTESSTYGCRHSNPKICKWMDLPGTCAFVSENKICSRPSNQWKQQYIKLKNLELDK